jgi:hypothetical protein
MQREAVQLWRREKQERAAREAAEKEQRRKEEAEAWAMRVRASRAQLLLLKSKSVNTVTAMKSQHSGGPRPRVVLSGIYPASVICRRRRN